MATRLGTTLGRYQIKAEIGRGSMGRVYRARDPRIDRTVAIKTVSLTGLEPQAEHEYRERFVVEAQAAGRLSHPGIVTIFDVGEDTETGAPYLVMEHVAGQPLDRLLNGENQRLPLHAALQLAQEVAEALHYAHLQGVVHRDIKPANILLTGDGHAKITDFGVAKLNQSQLTMQGQTLGTPAYMAPEQLSDEGVDGRSDLFSLGVVLYFMLTGRRPFQGSSIATVCFRLAHHEPLAVATYDMSFPPELDSVVSRALAKNPAQRYQSGGEMACDLQRLREQCGFIQNGDITPDANLQLPGAPLRDTTRVPGSESLLHSIPDTGVRGATRALSSLALTRTWIFALGLVAAALLFVVWSRTYMTPTPPNLALPNQPVEISLPPRPATAELHLEIEHPFLEAHASLWLDSHLVYTQALHADSKNHLLVFRKTVGHESHDVELPAGKHEVRVRVQSRATAFDQSRTVAVNFTPNGERTLRVNCDKKHNLLQVSLQ